MKIISKYKDFYDFLVGKYGQDEKIIFERDGNIIPEKLFFPDFENQNEPIFYQSDKNFLKKRHSEKISENNVLLHSVLFVGEEQVHIFVWKNKIYTNFDIVGEEKIGEYCKKFIFSDGENFFIYSFFEKPPYYRRFSWEQVLKIENLNFERNSENFIKIFGKNHSETPILLAEQLHFADGFHHENMIWENPILSKIGIFLNPEQTWQNIYNFLLWLKTEKEYYHEAKNDEKIVNKWFDIKTSFRPKMKK